MINDNKTVVITKWLDNKPIHIASNFRESPNINAVKRWDKSLKKFINVSQPDVIGLYNKSMGGVDLFDQLISYYRTFIKSKKWTLRVFSHFLDFAVTASWIEYRKDLQNLKYKEKDIMDLLHYRLYVAQALLKVVQPTANSKRGRPSTTQSPTPETSSNLFKRQRN